MLSLVLTADLQGVTELRPQDTEEDPYYYTFKVLCSSCREVHPNWVSFTRFVEVWQGSGKVGLDIRYMNHEKHEIPGSRGEANFVWKCKLCGKTHSANISAGPNAYEATDNAKKKTQKIVEFDCRGLEFTEFNPDGEWAAKGAESSTAFTEIDLTEGDWYDYDEKASEEVSIKEITWEIKNVK